MCIHCRSLTHLQCSTLKAILYSRKGHEWVCESCHLNELPFSELCKFQEITLTSQTTIDNVEHENIYVLYFKSYKKHLSIRHLNIKSTVLLFRFNIILQEHPFDTLALSETCLKMIYIYLNTWL